MTGFDPITAAMNIGGKLIDRLWPDPAQANEAKLKLLTMQQSGELTQMVEASGIIRAEASSEHWLTANWRPMVMMTFCCVIMNNYILYPYLSLFWPDAPMLEVPPDMWDLLKIGIGGYIIGRSGEKGIKAWKAPKE